MAKKNRNLKNYKFSTKDSRKILRLFLGEVDQIFKEYSDRLNPIRPSRFEQTPSSFYDLKREVRVLVRAAYWQLYAHFHHEFILSPETAKDTLPKELKEQKAIGHPLLYGKIHHDLYKYENRLRDLFNHFIDVADKKFGVTTEMHNEIVGLRNDVTESVRIIYKEIFVLAQHNIKIRSDETSDFLLIKGKNSAKKPCVICGEDRVHNFCHIIPREEGGAYKTGNLLNLCPTHHALFDRHRLSRTEWNKIDLTKKSFDSREYARGVILPEMKKFWRRVK